MGTNELTVVIPVYNEEKSIRDIIQLINEYVDCTMLAINDCSNDNSLKIMRGLQKKYKNLKIISKTKNQGFGAAWKTGIFNSKSEFVAFLDADLTYNPKYLPIMLKLIKKNKLDCIWSNRFGGRVNKMPLIRKIGNKALLLLFFISTGKYIPDLTSGQRIFRKKSLTLLSPDTLPNGLNMVSAISKRIVSRKLKYKIIPCDYIEREGSSKLNVVMDFIRMAKDILFER